MNWCLLAVLCLMYSSAVLAQSPDIEKKVVCYLRASSYRTGFNLKSSSYIPCTHIIYSFARINGENSSVDIDPADRAGVEDLKEFRNRNRSPLSILIQIGGEDDKEIYSDITSTLSKRVAFIQSIISLVNTYNFDGVDLHWKFPGRRVPPEKRNYVSLTQELRNEFDKGDTPKLISMMLPSERELIIPGFNLLFLNAVVDFFSVPGYNFTMSAPPHTYHHSPLTNSPESNITDNSLITMTRLYLRLGVVAERLLLGIPLFGRLTNSNSMEIENPELPNNQICHMLQDEGWIKAGNSLNGPLLKKDDQVLSYDSLTSIEEKAKLVNVLRLGGVMLWTMDMDDWNMTCPIQEGSFLWPNIDAANKVIRKPNLTSAISSSDDNLTTILDDKVSTLPPDYATLRPILLNYPSRLPEENYGQNGGNNFVPPPVVRPPAIVPGTIRPFVSAYGTSSFQSGSQSSSFFQNYLPFFKIIEAGKDILIEDTQIQINENYFNRPNSVQRGR